MSSKNTREKGRVKRRKLQVESLEDRRLLATASVGGSVPHENMQPSLVTNYIIALQGVFPSPAGAKGEDPIVLNADGSTNENPLGSDPYIGEISMFGGNFAPQGWAQTDGQLLPIINYTALFSIIGCTYGGDCRTTFALPDLRGRVPIGAGTGAGLSPRSLGERSGEEKASVSISQIPSHQHNIDGFLEPTGFAGGNQSHSNIQPFNTVNYIIAMQGTFPSPNDEPFLGEIRMFGGNFAPRGWALTNGQLLTINSNQALFSILGTTYGGDGETTFALPDLRGRVPVHPGSANGPTIRLGDRYGRENETLSLSSTPAHIHDVPGASVDTSSYGGGLTHENSQPSLGVHYLVATSGEYPSRNGAPSQQNDPGVSGVNPYLGEITMFAGNFAPRNWTFTNAQLLPIANFSALFSLYGTFYGGDGRSTFGIPDMRGRAAIHHGNGPGLTPRSIGEKTGDYLVALSLSNLPAHTHTISPPTVERVSLNSVQIDPADFPKGEQPTSWATQRSDLLSIEIEFSQPMNVTPSDFSLVNLGVDAPNDNDVEFSLQASHLTGSGTNTVTLTFLPDDLSDGVYELEVRNTAIDVNNNLIDGNRNGTGGDSYIYSGNANNKFYQLQADWSGDDGVSVFDFTTFSYWFGEAVPVAPAYADPSRDGGVSVFDFSNFSTNFGLGVTYPGAAAGLVAIANIQRETNNGRQVQTPALVDTGNAETLDRVLRDWNTGERVETQRPNTELGNTGLDNTGREELFADELVEALELDFEV